MRYPCALSDAAPTRTPRLERATIARTLDLYSSFLPSVVVDETVRATEAALS
jgi:hypothetical protein